MKRHTLLGILLIITVAFLGTWLGQDSRRRIKQHELSQSGPDYFMSGLTAISMDTTGRPRYTLNADRLVHLPDEQATALSNPRLVIHDAKQDDWHVSAIQGKVEQEGERVSLQGDVRVRQEHSDPGRALNLATQSMVIYPRRGQAETADAVHITRADSRIDAVGMSADIDNRQLSLHSQVRGYYER